MMDKSSGKDMAAANDVDVVIGTQWEKTLSMFWKGARLQKRYVVMSTLEMVVMPVYFALFVWILILVFPDKRGNELTDAVNALRLAFPNVCPMLALGAVGYVAFFDGLWSL